MASQYVSFGSFFPVDEYCFGLWLLSIAFPLAKSSSDARCKSIFLSYSYHIPCQTILQMPSLEREIVLVPCYPPAVLQLIVIFLSFIFQSWELLWDQCTFVLLPSKIWVVLHISRVPSLGACDRQCHRLSRGQQSRQTSCRIASKTASGTCHSLIDATMTWLTTIPLDKVTNHFSDRIIINYDF
jgi:hypothetical protein